LAKRKKPKARHIDVGVKADVRAHGGKQGGIIFELR